MAGDSTFNIEELSAGVDLQAELNKAKEELESLREEYRKATEGQEQLTTRKIAQFLRDRGYQVKEKMSNIIFTIDDEIYELYTDELPMVNMIKRFRIDKEDEVDFRAACQRVIEQGRMTKAFVTDNGEGIYFYMTSIETDCKHYEECFDKYLAVLNNGAEACLAFYNQMKDERRTSQFSKGPKLEKES